MSKTSYFYKVPKRSAIPEIPTLLDQFAMAALPGLLVATKTGDVFENKNQLDIAASAYDIAYAMIWAREKGGGV